MQRSRMPLSQNRSMSTRIQLTLSLLLLISSRSFGEGVEALLLSHPILSRRGGGAATPIPSSSSPAFFRGGDSVTATAIQSLLSDDNENNNDNNNNDLFPSDQEIIPTEFIAETNLPTDIGHFRLRAYRVRQNLGEFLGTEPCVIYATHNPPGDCGRGGAKNSVPVRIHDQCFTSEVFRSQRCDCKAQLKMALTHILHHGGAIIYLQQEGRGIGLANKIAAYALQDSGLDTVDANIHLGFPEDNRKYGVVPSILKDLGIESVELLTNNPLKVERLRKLGVKVEKTVPMVVGEEMVNQWNRRYLETKMERMRHENFKDKLSNPKFVLPVLTKNGMMIPKKNVDKSHSLDPNGALAASQAIESALQNDITPVLTGVRPSASGYCFGKKTVEAAIKAVARGEMVVVVDDENRENEGDFIMAGDLATPEKMAVMIRYTSGVVCLAMEGDRMDHLDLPPMVKLNEDPKGTAFSISVDASKLHGITTGISATDRAKTTRLLSTPTSIPSDFHRPGHIFPLRANPDGVLSRNGHTEAAVDLARMAGRFPTGVLCEIVSEENPLEMARLPELKKFCAKHGFVLTSIVDIVQYRKEMETEGEVGRE